jgi:hypothetical protein
MHGHSKLFIIETLCCRIGSVTNLINENIWCPASFSKEHWQADYSLPGLLESLRTCRKIFQKDLFHFLQHGHVLNWKTVDFNVFQGLASWKFEGVSSGRMASSTSNWSMGQKIMIGLYHGHKYSNFYHVETQNCFGLEWLLARKLFYYVWVYACLHASCFSGIWLKIWQCHSYHFIVLYSLQFCCRIRIPAHIQVLFGSCSLGDYQGLKMNCMWLIFMGELGNHHALYIITRAFKDMDSVFCAERSNP